MAMLNNQKLYWKVNFGVYPIVRLTYIYYIWKHPNEISYHWDTQIERAGSWDASRCEGCVSRSQTPTTNVQNPEDLPFKVVLSFEKSCQITFLEFQETSSQEKNRKKSWIASQKKRADQEGGTSSMSSWPLELQASDSSPEKW